ncbi:hypothetical protein EB796_022474 [Bugula neritina]|uniref:Uncharacterized protein n=1 Tax=Bugula neritina TaxID=10212 RepID=A0A7J7J0H3_BUGNE|nr:hypothetical protein EB796_022474 [Bugula neritina]
MIFKYNLRHIMLITKSKVSQNLPDISQPVPPPKYGKSGGSYGQVAAESSIREPQTNLSKMNSSSMANLSYSNETLLMAGHARRRPINNSNKLGKLGKLERSRSAPTLNGDDKREHLLSTLKSMPTTSTNMVQTTILTI